MCRRRAKLATPFVVTVSLASLGACGGISEDGRSAGTGGGDGFESGTRSSEAGITEAGAAEVDVADPCPLAPPSTCSYSSQQAPCTPGRTCSYQVACQSGDVAFTYECSESHEWALEPKTCDPARPYDSCASIQAHCDSTLGWVIEVCGSNPPAPCPATAPKLGEACLAKGMYNGFWFPCGYACTTDAGTGWSVVNCPFADGSVSAWQLEAACAAP